MIESNGLLQACKAAGPLPRILLLIGHLEGGGAERQCYLLACGLRASGFPVIIVSQPPRKEIVEAYEELGTIFIPLERRPSRSAIGRILREPIDICGMTAGLYRILRTLRPTVIHAYLPRSNCAAVVLGRLAGIPIIVASHRYAGSANPNYDVWQAVEAVFCRLADGNVANSGGVAAHIRKRLLLPIRTIRTIHNGAKVIDVERCRQFRGLLRKELGIAETDVALVTVANLWVHKGYQDLVRALSIATKNDHRLRAFFVGADRGYRSTLQRLISDLGLTEKISLLGERRDLCRLLPAFDIYVSASHGEGMSNAVMEAMQHGLPIIASHVAGMAELLADGDLGPIFEPGDIESLAGHILKLAADEELRCELGRRGGRQIQECFTDSQMVRATLDFYATLARRRGLERDATYFETGAGLLNVNSHLLQAIAPLEKSSTSVRDRRSR